MIRKLTFLIGLLLGLTSIILAGTAILTYLLTGKLVAVEVEETTTGRRPIFKLVSVDDALAMVKQARSGAEGGTSDAD
jgi:hypothetical protein